MYREVLGYTDFNWDAKLCQLKESDTTIEDIIEFVHINIYKELNTTANSENNSDEDMKAGDDLPIKTARITIIDEAEDDEEKNIPRDCVFPCYMAYILWRDFAEENSCLSIFTGMYSYIYILFIYIYTLILQIYILNTDN